MRYLIVLSSSSRYSVLDWSLYILYKLLFGFLYLVSWVYRDSSNASRLGSENVLIRIMLCVTNHSWMTDAGKEKCGTQELGLWDPTATSHGINAFLIRGITNTGVTSLANIKQKESARKVGTRPRIEKSRKISKSSHYEELLFVHVYVYKDRYNTCIYK